MPDLLDSPRGPSAHRPHYDYDAVRTYCGECCEQWPCRTHREAVIAAYLGDVGGPDDDRDQQSQPAGDG